MSPPYNKKTDANNKSSGGFYPSYYKPAQSKRSMESLKKRSIAVRYKMYDDTRRTSLKFFTLLVIIPLLTAVVLYYWHKEIFRMVGIS